MKLTVKGHFFFIFGSPEADSSRDFFMGRWSASPRFVHTGTDRSCSPMQRFRRRSPIYSYLSNHLIAVGLVVHIAGLSKGLHKVLEQIVLHRNKTPFNQLEPKPGPGVFTDMV